MLKLSSKFWMVTLMVVAAAFARLIPHPPNFTPVAAIALFGGAYYSKKSIAYLIPLAAMFTTDLILGFHNTMWAVYLSFIIIVGLGMIMLRKKNIKNVVVASLISSVLFFVLTNAAFWLTGTMYPVTLAGLSACFIAAIPFFQNTLIGDLVFTGVMFAAFEFAKVKFPQLAEVKA
jgi:Family of unknown function (DUF6580)